MSTYYVYILASKASVLYTGITNDIYNRTSQHKEKINPGFTKKYQVDCLVYYESFSTPLAAIEREKQIKSYRREKKVALIDSMNPQWVDISQSWFES